MRIAMLAACPFPSYQGSQVFVRELCDALSRSGHEIELLTYGQADDGDESRPIANYVHHRIGRLPGDDALRSGPRWIKFLLDCRLGAALSKLLTTGRFDIVHCQSYEAAVVAATVSPLRAVPVVYHSHGLLGVEFPTYFRNAAVRWMAVAAGRCFDRAIPRIVDHTVALTRYDAEQFTRIGLDAARITVVPPAIVDFSPGVDSGGVRQELALPTDRFVVGYCGNLDAYQDLATLAVAIRQLSLIRKGPKPLWLVATHALDGNFARLLADTGVGERTRILQTKSFAQTRLAMAACDVLVLPRGTRCGFPIKLLNYLATGKPVVAAGGGCGILADGVDGLTVRPEQTNGMVEGLARIATDRDLAGRLGQNGRRRFLADFTWERVLPAIENVYATAKAGRGAVQRTRAMLR